MSTVFRANRKTTDEDIIRLNSVGLSLSTIAEQLGCHPTTVTLRLKALGVPPADTRRAFMEGIYLSLTPKQREWLEDQVGPGHSIKDFVRNLMLERYLDHTKPATQGDKAHA